MVSEIIRPISGTLNAFLLLFRHQLYWYAIYIYINDQPRGLVVRVYVY
jgi:hypothetical protein